MFTDIWSELEQGEYRSPDHSFAYLMAEFNAGGESTRAEQIKKSTKRCHTSCPECLEEFGVNALGSLIGPVYTDKRMLSVAIDLAMSLSGGTVRRVSSDIDSMVEGLSDWASMNRESPPIELNSTNGPRILRPMMQPVDLWSELDLDCPIDLETGIVNEFLRIKMSDSGWN